jgi:hypothetical protein
MIEISATRPTGQTVSPNSAGGSYSGKRYGDDISGIEVLCTKSGAGTLSVDGRPLIVRAPKRLPSSD